MLVNRYNLFVRDYLFASEPEAQANIAYAGNR